MGSKKVLFCGMSNVCKDRIVMRIYPFGGTEAVNTNTERVFLTTEQEEKKLITADYKIFNGYAIADAFG